MTFFIKNFNIKIYKYELFLGLFMIFLSLIIPNFLLSNSISIYEEMEKAINFWDKEFLLNAIFWAILQSILKSFPIFFSVFLIIDSIDIFIKNKKNIVLKILLGIVLVQGLYSIIYKIYFDMSYYLGKVAILEMIYITFYLNDKFKKINLLKKNIILFLVFIAIQCLDTTQYFSILDSSNAEPLFELKVLANLMDATNLLNFTGIIFSTLFFTFAMTILLFFMDQEKSRILYKNEVEMNKNLINLRIKEMENRYYKEIQFLVHDLKTPLFSISTLIEILNMQEINQKRKTYYKKIEKSLNRCNIIISEILRDSDKNAISINKIFNFIFSYLSSHACINYIHYNNYSFCDKKIKVNKIVFSRALINLIINSYEAFSGKDDKIDIVIKDYFYLILIKIEDNGIGMTPEVLNNIFTTGFSKKGSSGIGLNFVKSVMDEHSCSIVISPKKEKGTCVYIIINRGVLENEK